MRRDARRENRADSRADSKHHRRGTACRRQHGDSCSLADSMTHEERHDQNNDREAIEANEAIGTVAESSTRNREKCIRAFLVAHSETGDSQQLAGRSAGVGRRGASPERKLASYAAVVMRWRVAQKRMSSAAEAAERRGIAGCVVWAGESSL